MYPTIRQSGNGPAWHDRLSKEGSAAARHVLVEAAWSGAKTPGPLRAFAQRTAVRRGRHVATVAVAVAVARKLAVLAGHLLTRAEEYAFQRPSLVRRKLRALELMAGGPRAKSGPNANPVWKTPARTPRSASRRSPRWPNAGWSPLAVHRPKGGVRARTGARISTALEGQAAGQLLLTPALCHVDHPHPPARIPPSSTRTPPRI
ncbi:MAG: transposase [Solirubrobacteraceae bacterium]